MPEVEAVSFSRMGGNSLKYKVKAATGETYMLKISAVDLSSELLSTMLGASRVALDAALAPHKTRWLQVCTRLVGKAGLGPKLLAANESAMVIEFVKGKVLGPAGSVDAWFRDNPEAHVRLGRFYAKLGKIDVFADAEAAEIASKAMTNHPFNFKDPVQALLGLPEARCGWPNVKEVKRASLRELQQLAELPHLKGIGAQLVFVQSDNHAENIMMGDDGNFSMIDMEMASQQPAGQMLYNGLLTLSGDASALQQRQSAAMHETGMKRNVALGYLMEATGMEQSDPRLAAELRELLFAIEFYRSRREFHQALLMAVAMNVRVPFITSMHGLLLSFATNLMELQRMFVTKAVNSDENLRIKIAESGLYAAVEDYK